MQLSGDNLKFSFNDGTNESILKADGSDVITKNRGDEIYASASKLSSMSNRMDSLARSIDNHVSDTNNPHRTTATDVGALPVNAKTGSSLYEYEVPFGVDFLSKLCLENREAGVSIPVMFDVVDNETEEVTTFRITIPSVGGFKIDFAKGTMHTFLDPDGSVVLTKNVADTLYPTKEELNEKADRATTLAGYGITDAATKDEVAALAAKVDAANTALEEVA